MLDNIITWSSLRVCGQEQKISTQDTHTLKILLIAQCDYVIITDDQSLCMCASQQHHYQRKLVPCKQTVVATMQDQYLIRPQIHTSL